jgi:hypothetical protein
LLKLWLTDWFKVDNFWSHKLWGAKQNLELLEGLEPARQPKVDDFDPIAGFGETEDVFRLKNSHFRRDGRRYQNDQY